MKQRKIKNWFVVANVLLVLGLGGAAGYLYMENRDLSAELNLSADERTRIQNEQLIAEVSELFKLPDEEPEVIYVNDGEKASSDNPGITSVFKELATGDYLLVYRKARLGVQYRPADKRVVFSSTIAIPIAVELIGSQEAINAAAIKLAEFGNQVTVTSTVAEGVTQPFVFDVDDDQSDEAKSVSDQLGIDISSTLPSTITPDALTEIVVAVTDDVLDSSDDPIDVETPEQP